MKLIIAGSRECNVSIEEIQSLIDHYQLKPTAVVSGKARGIDTCGEKWAESKAIPIIPYPVTKEDWETIGKSAGHKRNAKMAEVADALLLIWDGKSSGSAGMKDLMLRKNKPIFEAIVEPITVKEKVAYVKSQGQDRHHHCHWPTCNKQVPPAQWGCKEHWFKLPKRLRDRIWATYKPGQEVTMTPSDAYLRVANEVQEWISNYVNLPKTDDIDEFKKLGGPVKALPKGPHLNKLLFSNGHFQPRQSQRGARKK